MSKIYFKYFTANLLKITKEIQGNRHQEYQIKFLEYRYKKKTQL